MPPIDDGINFLFTATEQSIRIALHFEITAKFKWLEVFVYFRDNGYRWTMHDNAKDLHRIVALVNNCIRSQSFDALSLNIFIFIERKEWETLFHICT